MYQCKCGRSIFTFLLTTSTSDIPYFLETSTRVIIRRVQFNTKTFGFGVTSQSYVFSQFRNSNSLLESSYSPLTIELLIFSVFPMDLLVSFPHLLVFIGHTASFFVVLMDSQCCSGDPKRTASDKEWDFFLTFNF